jgi:hypothetical protein
VTDVPIAVNQPPDEPVGVDWDAQLQLDAIAVRDALAVATRRWQYIGNNPPGVSPTAYNGYELLNRVAQNYLDNYDAALAPYRRGG